MFYLLHNLLPVMKLKFAILDLHMFVSLINPRCLHTSTVLTFLRSSSLEPTSLVVLSRLIIIIILSTKNIIDKNDNKVGRAKLAPAIQISRTE